MEEEKRVDLKRYILESKVKKIFKKHFDWWEQLSLREVKNNIPQTKIRKNQMEQYFGYVEEQIEKAIDNQLRYILGQKEKDKVLELFKTLSIEEYTFVKDQEKSAYI